MCQLYSNKKEKQHMLVSMRGSMNSRTLLVGIWNGSAIAGNIKQFLKKFKHRICDVAIPFPGIYPKELQRDTQTNVYIEMFIEAIVTIAKSWKPPKCQLMDECINKNQTGDVTYFIVTHTHTHVFWD